MKLKYALEPVELGDEIICVPVGKGAKQMQGVIRLNRSAKAIIDLLGSETSEEQMVDTLQATYENDRETLAAYVHGAVSKLRDLGCIED